MATFYDLSIKRDPVTKLPIPVQIQNPRLTRPHHHITTMTNAEITRELDELKDRIFDVFASTTQMPFGGPVIYLKNVPFESETVLVLGHRFEVPPPPPTPDGSARPWHYVLANSPIRLFVGHMSVPGLIQFVSADQRSIWLKATVNCVADLVLMRAP